MPLKFDKANDTYICPIHGDVGQNTGWVRCHAACEDGFFDAYEEDPIFFRPGDVEICVECKGKGGFLVCGECNKDNPDVDW